MAGFLKRLYRETGTPKERIIYILIFGLFIFLFLFLFRPFGLGNLETLTLLAVTMGFGILTTFVIFLFKYLIDPVFLGLNYRISVEETLLAAVFGEEYDMFRSTRKKIIPYIY